MEYTTQQHIKCNKVLHQAQTNLKLLKWKRKELSQFVENKIINNNYDDEFKENWV